MQTSRLTKEVLIGAGVLALLSACAPTREEIDAKVDTAIGQEVGEVPETFSTEADFGEVEVGWIDTFRDPLLKQLVEEAQQNNKNLRSAALNVDRSWALARQAGAALLPSLDLTSGAQTTSQSLSNNLRVDFQVSWELDLWGRVRTGAWAAQASAEAVEADYIYAQHSLAASTAKAYFTAIEANLQTVTERETVEILTETLRIVQIRFDNELGSVQDVSLARSDLALANDRFVAAEGAYRDALRALELLLGRYPAADISLASTLPELPPAPPVGVPSELLERRPDFVAAERRVAAAFNATEQARAARLPTIGLTGNAGGASNSLSTLTQSGNTSWSLGLNLLAPLFDGGVLREQVEIANLEQEQALAQYGETALNAFGELENALDQGVVLARRSVELAEAVDQASEAYRIANLNYNAGETDLLSVLTIQQRVISAQRGLTSLQRLLLDQRIDLHLALGGSWDT